MSNLFGIRGQMEPSRSANGDKKIGGFSSFVGNSESERETVEGIRYFAPCRKASSVANCGLESCVQQ
jgi:hypothetical protein